MTEKNKKTILVAEDDTYISRAYGEGLKEAGFDVIFAYDGEETMKKVRSENPDLILLDLIMPVKNGFEALEEMNADAQLKKIPVIILSNLGQDSDVEKGKLLGASEYLIKSDLTMDEVIEKVKSYLEK